MLGISFSYRFYSGQCASSGLAMSMFFILHPWENSSLNYLLLFCELKGGLSISALSEQRIQVSDFTNRCCLLCFSCSVCICLLHMHPEFTSGKKKTQTSEQNAFETVSQKCDELLYCIIFLSVLTSLGAHLLRGKKQQQEECIVINSGSSNLIIISACLKQINQVLHPAVSIIEKVCKYRNTGITMLK